MKISINQVDGYYRADCVDLPGSPPVGLGNTPEAAMAHLMWLLLFDETGGPCSNRWSDFLRKGEPISVNDVLWELPRQCRD